MHNAQEYIVSQVRKELGNSEATEHLIDWLLDSWSTLEVLKERFGERKAMQLYTASLPFSLAGKAPEAILV